MAKTIRSHPTSHILVLEQFLGTTLPGTRLNETHKTNGAEKLGVSRKRKRIWVAARKLAGEQNMHFKQIPLARVGVRGPKKKKTNQTQPKLVSKQNENENEWAQKVRSFVFWCPRESNIVYIHIYIYVCVFRINFGSSPPGGL